MFSVDNFYEYLNSYYGFESDGRNVLLCFNPFGSKNWLDLKPILPMESDPDEHTGSCPGTLEFFCSHLGAIILHDQEPFDHRSLDTYRLQMQKEKNSDYAYLKPDQVLLFGGNMRCATWPIFCHSELNSQDVDFVEKSGGIPCYYFYHGLIARDWFRHWKHHNGISLDKGISHRFLLYARGQTGSRAYRRKLLADLQPLRDHVLHNWDQDQQVDACYSAKISVKDSIRTAIHLVAETVFDQQKIHLTEKIFKPIVMLQPFIVFSGSGSLKYLRDLGFKTFDRLWDESYDSETDHNKRYEQILHLIHTLSKYSDQQMERLLVNCRDIVLHNRERFFSEEFEQDLLNELHGNFALALDKQSVLIKNSPGGGYLQVVKQLLDQGLRLSHHRLEDINGRLNFIGRLDQQRLQNIMAQHPWLSRMGFI